MFNNIDVLPTGKRYQMAIADMDALEGLRGILALHVMFYHTNTIPPNEFFTATAMSFFIVLSGFSCARGYASTNWSIISVLRFYRKRLVRIFPVHLLAQGLLLSLYMINVSTKHYT